MKRIPKAKNRPNKILTRMHRLPYHELERCRIRGISLHALIRREHRNVRGLPETWKLVTQELPVSCNWFPLSGRIDAVYVNEQNGTIHLVDWKSTIPLRGPGSSLFASSELTPRNMCKNRYQLQLNLYRMILLDDLSKWPTGILVPTPSNIHLHVASISVDQTNQTARVKNLISVPLIQLDSLKKMCSCQLVKLLLI